MNKGYLIDELDEVIYVSDPTTYQMLYLNMAGKKITGTQGDTYLGQPCYAVLQGREAPCPFCTNSILNSEAFHIWEHTNDYLNRHFIVKDKLVDWDGRPARMEFAIDITEKENVSRTLADKLATENAMLQCIRSLLSSGSLDEAIQLVLKSIGKFYEADRTYIFEIDYPKHSCKNTYEWCNKGIAGQKEFLQNVNLDLIRRWMVAFQKNQPIIIENMEEIRAVFPEEYRELHQQNIDSLYAVPLKIQDNLEGYIGLDNPRKKGAFDLLNSLSYFIVNEMTKRRMQSRLEFMSYHDTLSGLQNRNRYAEYLNQVEEEALSSIGVIVADINGLKQINQNFGHQMGDFTVKNTANILKKHFDERTIFRLDGDEFVILCENMNRQEFMERIQRVRADVYAMNNYGVSLGYTWADLDIDIPLLVNHADELMFINKQEYYKNSSAISKHHHPEAIRWLLNGIEDGRFVMYLQPKIAIQSGKIIGAEALVRMRDPEHGIIPPGKFIPALEKTRNIRYIDFFIYEEVCKTLYAWKKQGKPLFPISLNFSRITMLETDLMKVLLSIHEKYDVPRALIEIEITESMGEMERETIASIATSIKNMGFGISLDDFGAEYTNMSMLTIMKFNVLKLDRSLVNDIVHNIDNRIVVRHVVEMCRELGVQSLAEGVENTEQLELLRQISCDVAQGYLFSKPIPLTEFEEKYLSALPN